MLNEVKRRTGWKTVDEIEMRGDQRGRDCTALSGGDSYDFFIRFDSKGAIQTFAERHD